MIELKQCPVCKSANIKLAYSSSTTRGQDKKVWTVFECVCSHQFMNPQPSWDELSPYYGGDYTPYNPRPADDENKLAEARQSGLFRHIPITDGKRILDVGCGGGSFLRLAKMLGAKEQGVELSEHGVRACRNHGLNVFEGTLEQYASTSPEKFDCITSSHVVEHLPDPVETLRMMKSLLAPGGIVWVGVPNASYPINKALSGKHPLADLPLHLMQFTPKSLIIAAERANLKLLKQTTESLAWQTELSLGLFLRYKLMVPRAITLNLRLLKPFARWYGERADRQNNGEAILAEFV